MIRTENISFAHGKKNVLKNISFNVKKGEIYGVMGPNGSGKTTLTKVITNFYKNYTGKIFVEEKEIKMMTHREITSKMSVVTQENNVFMPYSVEEIILSGRYHNKKFFGNYSEEDFEVVKELMKKINIYEIRNKNINKISGGEKQLAFIARALASESDTIIFDEPTSNLDMGHNGEIFKIIKSINREYGKTIIIISHDINFIMSLCNRVMVMDKGVNIFTGNPKEVLDGNILQNLYNIPLIYSMENNQIKYVIPDITDKLL